MPAALAKACFASLVTWMLSGIALLTMRMTQAAGGSKSKGFSSVASRACWRAAAATASTLGASSGWEGGACSIFAVEGASRRGFLARQQNLTAASFCRVRYVFCVSAASFRSWLSPRFCIASVLQHARRSQARSQAARSRTSVRVHIDTRKR